MHDFLYNLKPEDYDLYSLEVSFLYDVETGDIPWLGRPGEEQSIFILVKTIDRGKFTLSWNHEKYRIIDVELSQRTETSEEVIIQSMVEYNKHYGY